MKLILSSCDFRNDNARKVIIENINMPVSDCRILFIPNEKATYQSIHSDKYYDRMKEFGFSPEHTYIFDYYHPEAFVDLKIDVLYISGGNTFETLNRLRNCGFVNKIIDYVKQGVIYIGGSAGAHIASINIEHVAGFDSIPDGMTDFTGLGLFDGILICHYTEERKFLFEQLSAKSKYPVYALCDNDSIIYCCDEDGVSSTQFFEN